MTLWVSTIESGLYVTLPAPTIENMVAFAGSRRTSDDAYDLLNLQLRESGGVCWFLKKELMPHVTWWALTSETVKAGWLSVPVILFH